MILLKPVNAQRGARVIDRDVEAFRGIGGHPRPPLSQGQPGWATRVGC